MRSISSLQLDPPSTDHRTPESMRRRETTTIERKAGLKPASAIVLAGILSLVAVAGWVWRPAIEGVVVVGSPGSPSAGAVVTLLDGNGQRLDLTVTDANGRFHVEGATGARLRVEAIGRATVHAPVPSEGEARIELDVARITLPSTGPSVCAAGSPADPAGILWAEVRKALQVEAWARSNHVYSYDLFQYERRLSERERVESEQSRRLSNVTEGPARTRPAEELNTAGYARTTPRGDVLYAPTADVMLTPGFEQTHCFRVGPSRGGRIGLTFEPTVTSGRVDIGGVMWIDASTAELAAVEFHYTGLGAPASRGPGGVIDFARLHDGLWSVAKWAVRTPAPRSAPEAFREEGVEVIRVVRLDGTAHPVMPRAQLLGIVRDTAGATLAGANVQIAGTHYVATTNAEGRFYIPELPPGRFHVTVANAPVRSGHGPPGQDVFLTASQSTQIDMNLGRVAHAEQRQVAMSAEDSVRRFLEAAGLARSVRVDSLISSAIYSTESGRVIGRVFDRSTGKGISGVEVRLAGTNRAALTEADGRFHLGDVPNGPYLLQTEMIGYAPRNDSIAVPAGLVIDAAVALTTKPIELEPISVTVVSRWLDTNGFFERRRAGLDGHFFTRADIEKEAPAEFTDLLKDLPGVFIMTEEVGKTMVRFRRTTTIARSAEEARGCQPGVYYDGIPLNIGFDLLHSIPVPFIDGVEVYVGAATPIDYKNPCGVILIWTRRPR